jgi:hypothetical protein
MAPFEISREPPDTIEVRKALAVPTRRRGGELSLPTSQATEGELKNILIALKNPPQRADAVAVWSTLAGSGAAMAKVVKDRAAAGSFDELSVIILLIACIALFASVWKYVEASRKRYPFHTQAIDDVDALIQEARDRI